MVQWYNGTTFTLSLFCAIYKIFPMLNVALSIILCIFVLDTTNDGRL